MSDKKVVIVRKDKRIRHKLLHAAAFAVTGGVSGAVTAAEAANHASYNARTRQLQDEVETLVPQQHIDHKRYRREAEAIRKAEKAARKTVVTRKCKGNDNNKG